MADPFIRDPAYEQKVQDIVVEALMVGLMDPETRTSVWRVGEITSVMLTMVAMLAADSPVTSSPVKTREFCAQTAKRLQRQVVACKARFAAGQKPFSSMTIEGELH